MEDFLHSLAPFTKFEINDIINTGKFKKANKGDTLFHSGLPFSKLWYIEEGMIRAYRIIHGDDFTFFFFPKGEFAVDFQSYLTDTESMLFFEALTEIKYIEFSKESIESLFEKYPKFEKVGRLMAERAYLSATDRLKQFQAGPLESRYLKLLEKAPDLFQQIPLYHIASYLGVKPQSLSRIRAKLVGKSY